MAKTAMREAQLETLLTIREAASFLAVPPSWLYQRTRLGVASPVPHVRLGGQVRFVAEDLRRFVRAHRVGGRSSS
jgi:excisionase family DNA binding protein